MGRILRECRCGNLYAHREDDAPECPDCGKLGTVYRRVFHRCSSCGRIEVCAPEKKEGLARSGVCPDFKRPDPVRYKRW